MKTLQLILVFSLMSNFIQAQSDSLARKDAVQKLESINLSDIRDSLSYAFGVTLSEQLKNSPFDSEIDRVTFIKGFIESSNDKAFFTLAEAGAFITENDPSTSDDEGVIDSAAEEDYTEEVEVDTTAVEAEDYYYEEVEVVEEEEELPKVANKIKLEATEKKFFKENLQRDEIKTTQSGIQYELILGNGKGTKPKPTDKIRIHYNATYLNGEQVDQSKDLYYVNIKYKSDIWKEIYSTLRVGSTYKFYLPTYFYSTVPASYDVEIKKEPLIYTIELIEIEEPYYYDDED